MLGQLAVGGLDDQLVTVAMFANDSLERIFRQRLLFTRFSGVVAWVTVGVLDWLPMRSMIATSSCLVG